VCVAVRVAVYVAVYVAVHVAAHIAVRVAVCIIDALGVKFDRKVRTNQNISAKNYVREKRPMYMEKDAITLRVVDAQALQNRLLQIPATHTATHTATHKTQQVQYAQSMQHTLSHTHTATHTALQTATHKTR